MAIGDFEPGATIVVQERWRGMLWSAVPTVLWQTASG